MSNYNNGKIYKIEPLNGEEGEIYIGSTTKDNLMDRFNTHKSRYKRYLNGLSKSITSFYLFQKYGIDNCKIILLELVNANDKNELHSREAHYIKTLKCVNKNIPLRDRRQYYIDTIEKKRKYYVDNKNHIQTRMKNYYKNNRDIIKDKMKQYREIKQDYYKKYREDNKDKMKEYYKINKDKMKDYYKKYYETNKEKLKEYSKKYKESKKNDN